MENKLKILFKGGDPSVRMFESKLVNRSFEEVENYYAHAYTLGLTRWKELPTGYQDFLKRLVQHDRQRFLNFQRQNILGELCYSFDDPLLAVRLLALLETDEEQRSSDNHLAFSFLLGFDPSLSIEAVRRKITPRLFMPEELQDIKGKAIIYTGERE